MALSPGSRGRGSCGIWIVIGGCWGIVSGGSAIGRSGSALTRRSVMPPTAPAFWRSTRSDGPSSVVCAAPATTEIGKAADAGTTSLVFSASWHRSPRLATSGSRAGTVRRLPRTALASQRNPSSAADAGAAKTRVAARTVAAATVRWTVRGERGSRDIGGAVLHDRGSVRWGEQGPASAAIEVPAPQKRDSSRTHVLLQFSAEDGQRTSTARGSVNVGNSFGLRVFLRTCVPSR